MTKPLLKREHRFSEHVFGKDDPRQSLVLAASQELKRQTRELEREIKEHSQKVGQLKSKNTDKS